MIRLTKRGKATFLLAAVVILAIVIPMLLEMSYDISDGRYFQSTYGMHINRATFYSDAGMIKESLNQALVGIEELGLEPDDSYRILWFTDTGFSKVGTMIEHIDSVILSCEQVITWLEDMHGPSTTKEIGTDIYNVKVQNLQQMSSAILSREYRVERAWLIKHKPLWTLMYWLPWLVIPFTVPTLYTGLSGQCLVTDYDWERASEEAQEQWKKENKLFGIW